MDLSVDYLGFKLPHPLMPGASPMVDDLDVVRRLEDAGAAAIVMHSLFEEQIVGEQMSRFRAHEGVSDQSAEAGTYLPDPSEFALGPQEYLEQVAKIRKMVSVPVIGSLNGASPGGWLEYAKLIEQAGADALELNLYMVAADPWDPPQAIERRQMEVVRTVRGAVKIPVAVKLSPYYTSAVHFMQQLVGAGANGLVLFNRFYQPDIDVEELEVVRKIRLSEPGELPLRLHGLAIMSGRAPVSLACSGGVYDALHAIKAVMSGAHAVQMVSALLKRGPEHLAVVRTEMAEWLEQHEYESLGQALGSMSLRKCPDPKAYERANYMKLLQSWREDLPAVPMGQE